MSNKQQDASRCPDCFNGITHGYINAVANMRTISNELLQVALYGGVCVPCDYGS